MIFQTSAITTRGTPRKLTERMLQFVVEQFNRHGNSVHTHQGVTLAPLLNYLTAHRVSFTLEYDAKGGYYLKKADGR